MLLDNRLVAVLSIFPLLMHESHSGQPHFELSNELFPRKVALNSEPLFTRAIEDQNGRRPKYVEAVEICRRLLDVDGYWMKTLMDEVCNFLIGV